VEALGSPWSEGGCVSKGAVCGMDACIFVRELVSVSGSITSQPHKISHFPELGDEDENSVCKRLQNDLRIDAIDDPRALSLSEHVEVCKRKRSMILSCRSDFLIVRHPPPSHAMTIPLGSKGKGRDLEMGWWQYLPLGERSQRCVNAFVGAFRD
jgi:hypothetical protein